VKRFSLPDEFWNYRPSARTVACPWPEFRQNPSSMAPCGGRTNPQLRSVVDRRELLLPLCVQLALYRRPLRETLRTTAIKAFQKTLWP
jgi:hypothetical protein